MGALNSVLSSYFGNLSRCEKVENDIAQYVCDAKGAMWCAWFFAGILFWLNLLLAALIVLGKDDLATEQIQYEDIGVTIDEYDIQPSQQRSSFGIGDFRIGEKAQGSVYEQV